MRCRLFTLASALSLLLCLVTVVLWIFSYHGSIDRPETKDRFGLNVNSGEIEIAAPHEEPDLLMHRFPVNGWPLAATYPNHIGSFGYASKDEWRGSRVVMPIWTFAIITIALPTAFALTSLLRSRQSRIGHCPTCSYSLTGNTSGICPECGTAVAASANA